MYHEDVIGYGWNQGVTAEINYVPERVAHLINHSMSGNAVLIDDNGVVEVQHQ